MPIYEYRCNQCEREFEKYVQGVQTAVVCPACMSERVTRRLFAEKQKAFRRRLMSLWDSRQAKKGA